MSLKSRRSAKCVPFCTSRSAHSKSTAAASQPSVAAWSCAGGGSAKASSRSFTFVGRPGEHGLGARQAEERCHEERRRRDACLDGIESAPAREAHSTSDSTAIPGFTLAWAAPCESPSTRPGR